MTTFRLALHVLSVFCLSACGPASEHTAVERSLQALEPVSAPAVAAAATSATPAQLPLSAIPATQPNPATGEHAAWASLSLFASSVTGAWSFPSRYHYHEWRLANNLRASPRQVTSPTGLVMALRVRQLAPQIVILIDDLGNNGAALRRLAALPFVVNGAVLPFTSLARKAGAAIANTGGDVLLHLPLEPVSFPKDNPGPGALWVTWPTGQLIAAFDAAWASVPNRIGMNNHMGSRFTADAAAMGVLATGMQTRPHAIFVDSRTIPASRAAGVMVAKGIPALGRTHFLDEIVAESAVWARLDESIRYAQKQGLAVVIGHPNKSTLRVLEQAGPRFAAAGVSPVAIHTLFPSLASITR